MTSWTYIVQSVPWSLAGLLIGVFVGRLTVAADALAGAVQEGDTMPEPTTRRRLRITSNTVVVAVLVTLGLLTGVQAFVQGQADDRQDETDTRLTACLQDSINRIADALDARSTASGEAQQALDDLLDAVSSATPNPEGATQVRQAFRDYNAKRADAKKAQAANPYPAAPRDVCKETG